MEKSENKHSQQRQEERNSPRHGPPFEPNMRNTRSPMQVILNNTMSDLRCDFFKLRASGIGELFHGRRQLFSMSTTYLFKLPIS